MTYDPAAHGANCDACPFRTGKPVPPSVPIEPLRLVLVAESPGANEEIEGVPLIGASGRRFDKVLSFWSRDTNPITRANCHITNTVLCRPPMKTSPGTWAQARTCCSARLQAELKGIPKDVPALAFGEHALRALTGKSGIMRWMGAPLQNVDGRTVIPCPHPSLIMRKPSYEPVFRQYVGYAINPPTFQWPHMVIWPGETAADMIHKLNIAGEAIGVDVETAGIDPINDDLLCIGIGNRHGGVSVPWPCPDLPTEHALRCILKDEQLPKVFHNAQHDLLSLESKGVYLAGKVFDTLLAHVALAPQLPHDLGFVATMEVPGAPRWKTEFRVAGDVKGADVFRYRNEDELRTYNCKDAIITGMLFLTLPVRLRRGYRTESICAQLHELSAVAQVMRKRGIAVDEGARKAHRAGCHDGMAKAREQFQELIQKEGLDPNLVCLVANGQNDSLKVLFFQHYRIRPSKYSEITQQPSLDNTTLKNIISAGGIGAKAAEIALTYRQLTKVLSTYVDGLPVDDKTGLVHSVWKCWGTRTGRWSSSHPNIQNQPKVLRNMYIPRPGNVFVAADYSALELRIIAWLANDKPLLDAYATGRDIHKETAARMFGISEDDVTKDQRNRAKTIEYGFNYQFSDDVTTVWRTLVTKWPGLSMQALQYFRKVWFELHPALRDWQLRSVRDARRAQYVEAPISGRRIVFHDGIVDPNVVLNHPVQATAGDLANLAILGLAKETAGTDIHIVAQVHDEIVLEGPVSMSEKMKDLLARHMTQTLERSGCAMTFPVEVKVGSNWGAMKGM